MASSTAIPSDHNDFHYNQTAPPPSSSSSSSSFTTRLRKAQKSIQEATEEALRSAKSEETLSGRRVILKNNDSTIYGRNDYNEENAHPNILNENNDDDDEASFELGMSLFGDDVRTVERDLRERLERVEEQLQCVLMEGQEHQRRRLEMGGENLESHIDKDSGGNMEVDSVKIEDAEEEAKRLTAKVLFLKQCSMARSLLEECSTASSSSGKKLVEAATFLSKAQSTVKDAEHGLLAAMSSITSSSSSTSSLAAKQEMNVAKMILESIKMQCRRKRVDLYSKTSIIMESCITVTKSSLSVKGGGVNGGEGLADVYDALAVLTQQQNNDKVSSSAAVGSDRLENDISMMANNIYNIIFKPVLAEFEKDCTTDVKKQLASYQFTEHTSVDASSSSSSSTSTSIKGPTVTLEWKINEQDKDEEINDMHTKNIQAWSGILSFIQTILTFVHERILLKRENLSQIMGQTLFGGRNDAAQQSASLMTKSLQDMIGTSSLYGKYDGPLMKRLVDITWDTCILSSPVLPASELSSTLDGIKQMMRMHTDDFERDLMEKNFLPTSPLSENVNDNAMSVDGTEKQQKMDESNILPLSNLARNYERKYAEKHRSNLLSNGRDLLSKNDYHNTVEVGVDVPSTKKQRNNDPTENDGMSVFLLHKCAISKVASDLMTLCRQTMDESVEASKSCTGSPSSPSSLSLLPPTLYRTARELMDLFRAIIPTAHNSEVSTIPRTAAIFHNDCVYFAHNMLTFGHEYKEKFIAAASEEEAKANDNANGGGGTVLKQMCTFVDLVPPFRELADRTMENMIERQKLQILEIVGSRIGDLRLSLRSNDDVYEWSEAKTALTAGVYHVRHLSQAWRPILSDDVYGRAMGNLVDTLFSLYLDQVMKASDISETACHFVSGLFRDATHHVAELFDPVSLEGGIDIGRARCGLWDRFTAVGNFMDMSLADINLALAEGMFRSVTGPELSRLIKAVFDESEKRSMLLQALTSRSS